MSHNGQHFQDEEKHDNMYRACQKEKVLFNTIKTTFIARLYCKHNDQTIGERKRKKKRLLIKISISTEIETVIT